MIASTSNNAEDAHRDHETTALWSAADSVSSTTSLTNADASR
jgi:hypothetical protein